MMKNKNSIFKFQIFRNFIRDVTERDKKITKFYAKPKKLRWKLRLGDTRSFFRVGAMQHAPSHQLKKKSVCPMVSNFVSWDKKCGKYPKDTQILSQGQWSKIDSNQFCSSVLGTIVREILSCVRKKRFFVVSPPKIAFLRRRFIHLKFRFPLGKVK